MRKPFMKGLLERLEAAFVAAAFAEESEPEVARRMVAQSGPPAGESRRS